MLPQIDPLHSPKGLTPKQRGVLRSLMRRRFYDLNHPKDGRRFPILFRAFVPANYQGDPSVILVCQYTATDERGRFEYVVYSDGLHGSGHWASDKFGNGNMNAARMAFEEHLVFEVLGVWPWVIDRVRNDARALLTKGLAQRSEVTRRAASIRTRST